MPKDKGSLNCATFNAGIIEAVLTRSGFVSSENKLICYKYSCLYKKNEQSAWKQ